MNDLPNGLFSNHVVKPKKINSKFHIHVPSLKIKQLRVELDNLSSDFQNDNFIWKSSLHKGAGKTAMVTSFTNEKYYSISSDVDKEWNNTNDWYVNNIKPDSVYSFKTFTQ